MNELFLWKNKDPSEWAKGGVSKCAGPGRLLPTLTAPHPTHHASQFQAGRRPKGGGKGTHSRGKREGMSLTVGYGFLAGHEEC